MVPGAMLVAASCPGSVTARVVAPAPVSGLVDWLTSQPGGRVGPIRFADSEMGDGGGGYATRALKDGEELFSIPLSTVITANDAIGDQDVGEELERVCYEEGERAAIAGYLARGNLAASKGVDPWFSAYSAVLPKRELSDPHMLWWTQDEVTLLRGLTAHAECVSMRKEVAEVTQTLSKGALAAEVAEHGQEAVDEAVRAAYVSVLSRSFTVGSEAFVEMESDAEGSELKALIPLLDCLQHGPTPTVGYSYEDGEDGEGVLIVARTLGDQPAGTELSITYGSHPDFVFGVHCPPTPLPTHPSPPRPTAPVCACHA